MGVSAEVGVVLGEVGVEDPPLLELLLSGVVFDDGEVGEDVVGVLDAPEPLELSGVGVGVVSGAFGGELGMNGSGPPTIGGGAIVSTTKVTVTELLVRFPSCTT